MFGTNALTRGYLLNDDPGAGGGGEPPKPMTADEIQKLVGTTVNAALTSKLKSQLGPAIAESLKGVAWKDVLSPIVGELVPKPPEPGTQSDPNKPDPKLAALEAKYAELDRKHQEAEQRAAAAEAKSRDEKAFSSLKSALSTHVRPEMVDLAARDLFLAQKRVTFDENGRPLLTVRKSSFGGAEEDVQMTLEEGAAHWVKSEGKLFAPPPQNPGVRPGTAPRQLNTGRDGLPVYDTPATTDDEKVRRANERAEALARKYPNL